MAYKNKEDAIRQSKEWYDKNKVSVKERTRRRRERGREIINEAKNRPCMDCGVQYPYYVMEFDHRPGENVSDHLKNEGRRHRGMDRMINTTVEKLLLEIAKCDIVCANCHAERTHQRRFAPESKGGEFL